MWSIVEKVLKWLGAFVNVLALLTASYFRYKGWVIVLAGCISVFAGISILYIWRYVKRRLSCPWRELRKHPFCIWTDFWTYARCCVAISKEASYLVLWTLNLGHSQNRKSAGCEKGCKKSSRVEKINFYDRAFVKLTAKRKVRLIIFASVPALDQYLCEQRDWSELEQLHEKTKGVKLYYTGLQLLPTQGINYDSVPSDIGYVLSEKDRIKGAIFHSEWHTDNVQDELRPTWLYPYSHSRVATAIANDAKHAETGIQSCPSGHKRLIDYIYDMEVYGDAPGENILFTSKELGQLRAHMNKSSGSS